MEQIRFGKTGLMVSRSGFGAIPIQRISYEESTAILRRAYEGGINFYDTATGYTTSEDRIGTALSSVRKNIILATKTPLASVEQMQSNLEKSLRAMRTDYIDLYQLHNPKTLPQPGDGSGVYEFLLEAKEKGYIRHIGITNHSIDRAVAAAESRLYDSIQYPFNYLCLEKELKLSEICKEHDLGLIAMKGLSGGLINNAAAAFAFIRKYDNVIPIWGIQKMEELEEFLQYEKTPPMLTNELKACIERDREELMGEFCRSCGYCMPCPAGIEITSSARVMLLLGRSNVAPYVTKEYQDKMEKIENCLYCGQCSSKCPYGLDTPALLRRNLVEYRKFIRNNQY